MAKKKSKNNKISALKTLHPKVQSMIQRIQNFSDVERFIYHFYEKLYILDKNKSSEEFFKIASSMIEANQHLTSQANYIQKMYVYNILIFNYYERKQGKAAIEKFKDLIFHPEMEKMSFIIDTLAVCLIQAGGEQNLNLAKDLYESMFKVDMINLTIDDLKEGKVSVPLLTSMVREVND